MKSRVVYLGVRSSTLASKVAAVENYTEASSRFSLKDKARST